MAPKWLECQQGKRKARRADVCRFEATKKPADHHGRPAFHFQHAGLRSPAYFANSDDISANALNSSALPEGSRKNIVACSPTSPLKRTCGSMMKSMPAFFRLSGAARPFSLAHTPPHG